MRYNFLDICCLKVIISSEDELLHSSKHRDGTSKETKAICHQRALMTWRTVI